MACDFNGSSSLLRVASPTVNLKGAKTIRIRFTADSTAGAQYLCAINATGSDGVFGHFVAFTSGNIYTQVPASAGSTTNAQWASTQLTNLVAGKPYEAVITYSGTFTGDGATNIKIYIQGVEPAGTVGGAGTGSELDLQASINVGGHNVRTDRWFNGRIEDVRIDNRVWTAQEITDSFNGTEPSTSSMVYRPDLANNAPTTDLAGLQTISATDVGTTNISPRWGVQAWYRYDGVTGNPISALTDRCGNGGDLSQSTFANRPALYSGSDWPTTLIQNTDYDSAADAEKHTCLDRAAGAGATFFSQDITIFVVAGCAAAGSGVTANQTLLALGNPASASSGVVEIITTSNRKIAVRRSKTTAQTRTSNKHFTCNPRVWAIRCNATAVTVYTETGSETLTALTSDSTTGIRLGADLGTIDNAWMGDIAEVIIYGRSMSDTEMAAEHARLMGVYGLSTATKTLFVEGSSSAGGWRSTDVRGLMRPMYQLRSDLLLYNYADGGHTFTNFDNLADIQMIAANVPLPMYILGWLGANDLSSVSDNGATVYTDLTDWIAAVRADATIGPLLRQVIVTTILVNGTNTTRETSRQTYNTAIRGTAGVRVVDIASVAGLIPASNTVGDLGTICGGSLYADVQHLNDLGYSTIQTTVTGAIRQSISSTTNRLIPILAAIGRARVMLPRAQKR